jgi:hypothetical protein
MEMLVFSMPVFRSVSIISATAFADLIGNHKPLSGFTCCTKTSRRELYSLVFMKVVALRQSCTSSCALYAVQVWIMSRVQDERLDALLPRLMAPTQSSWWRI